MSSERIQVHPGETFEIALREPGATGHHWRLADGPESIALVDEQYEPPARAGPIGSPGRRVIILRASAEGQYSIRFELRRAWESEAADEHRVDVEVR